MTTTEFTTKYNNVSTGLFKTGQSRGIGSDDLRSLITDIVSTFGGVIVGSSSPDTTGGTVTLEFSDGYQVQFTGSDTISGNKTIELSNANNALRFEFIYELDDAYDFEMPVTFAFSDPNFNASANTYTHNGAGFYKLSGVWSGVLWICQVAGPYEFNT